MRRLRASSGALGRLRKRALLQEVREKKRQLVVTRLAVRCEPLHTDMPRVGPWLGTVCCMMAGALNHTRTVRSGGRRKFACVARRRDLAFVYLRARRFKLPAHFFSRSKFYNLIFIHTYIHTYHHTIHKNCSCPICRSRACIQQAAPTTPPRLRTSSASGRTLPVGARRLLGRCACSCGRPWCWRLLRAVTATRSQSRDSVQNGAGACASGGGMFVGLSSRFFADVDSTRRWTWHGRDARVVRVFLFRCATGTDGASCSTDSDADNQGRSSVPITHARHSLDIGSKPARCKRGRSVEHSPHDDASVQPCAGLLASCRTKSAIAGAHRPPPPDDSAGEASGGGGRGGGGLRGCGGARACCTAAAASGWGTTWRRRLKMGLRCGSCKYKCGTEIRWSCETVKAVRGPKMPDFPNEQSSTVNLKSCRYRGTAQQPKCHVFTECK